MSNLIRRLIKYTLYISYIQNITSKNVHVIMWNCVQCRTGLMLHNVVMLMVFRDLNCTAASGTVTATTTTTTNNTIINN